MINEAITGKWRFAFYFFLASIFISINYFTPRENFYQLISLYAIAFGSYILLLKYFTDEKSIREGKVLGILLRFVLLFSIPNLTDDFYRFMWDGNLIDHSITPYGFTPSQIITTKYSGDNINAFNPELYTYLNSKEYYSIYPPLCQVIFFIASLISGNNILLNIIVIKIFIFLFELATILLISKILIQLNLPSKYQLIYILNPLVILELCGNAHLEAEMIFFMTLSIYLLLKNKNIPSAIAFGFSIGAKLWPVMLLPLFFKYIGFKKTIIYSIIAIATSLFLLFPMILYYSSAVSSLNLYFQQFEFNASIYYLFKWIIGEEKNYQAFEIMRNFLPLITIISIVILCIRYNKKYFFEVLLITFTFYCFFTTTLHPWYLCPLILLSTFSSLRFVIIWSFLIYLSYFTYNTPYYIQNYYLIIVEYAVLFIFIIIELGQVKKINLIK